MGQCKSKVQVLEAGDPESSKEKEEKSKKSLKRKWRKSKGYSLSESLEGNLESSSNNISDLSSSRQSIPALLVSYNTHPGETNHKFNPQTHLKKLATEEDSSIGLESDTTKLYREIEPRARLNSPFLFSSLNGDKSTILPVDGCLNSQKLINQNELSSSNSSTLPRLNSLQTSDPDEINSSKLSDHKKLNLPNLTFQDGLYSLILSGPEGLDSSKSETLLDSSKISSQNKVSSPKITSQKESTQIKLSSQKQSSFPNQFSQNKSISPNQSNQKKSSSPNQSSQNKSSFPNQSSQNKSSSPNQSSQNKSSSPNQSSQNIESSPKIVPPPSFSFIIHEGRNNI